VVGLNRFALFACSFVILFILICQNDAKALVTSHHKRHKSLQSTLATESTHTGRSRHSKHHISLHHQGHKHLAARPRYAYPMGFFLMEAPAFEASPLSENINIQIKKAFYSGDAGEFPTRSLVRVGIVNYYPMRGGIFFRREPIKYLIMHSTEPGIPIGARTVIDGWSHGGRRHAGAHYVIERDGAIFQAVDPDLATVHINIFKTLPGINNDNSVGVEMCHQGAQDYPPAQVESAAHLAAYLQSHYHIADANVITHRYAQQGDHTDPVNFAWDNFIAQKNTIQNQGLSQKLALLKSESLNWQTIIEQPTIIVVDKKASPDLKKTTSPKPTMVPTETVPQKPTMAPIPTMSLTPTTVSKPTISPAATIFPTPAATSAISPKSTAVRVIEPSAKSETIIESATSPTISPLPTPTVQSPFEAKFGPIETPMTEPQIPLQIQNATAVPAQSSTPASAISNKTSNGTPKTVINTTTNNLTNYITGGPIRLLPTPPATRLLPVMMIINNQPINTEGHAVVLPSTNQNGSINPTNLLSQPSTNKRPSRLLPLRGPIEMDPNDASSLLSQ